MRCIAIASLTVVLLGCAGWGREMDARLHPDEAPLPLQIRCGVRVAHPLYLELPVVVEGPSRLVAVGELFDHDRATANEPDASSLRRHALVVDAPAFGETVRADVERCLGPCPGGGAPDAMLRLVVRIVDLQSTATDMGFTSLWGRVTSRVVLCAELRGASGDVLWSRTLDGRGEKRVFYYRIVHHETTLSSAYCAALAQLDEAMPEIVAKLGMLAAGEATVAPAVGEETTPP